MARVPGRKDYVRHRIQTDEKLRLAALHTGDLGGSPFSNHDDSVYTQPGIGSIEIQAAGGPVDVLSNGGGISHDSGGGGHDIQTGGGGYEVDTSGGGYTIDTGDGGYEVDAASIRLELAADGNLSIEDTAADGIFFDGGPSSDSEINLWADHINFHSADITGVSGGSTSMARSFLLMGT